MRRELFQFLFLDRTSPWMSPVSFAAHTASLIELKYISPVWRRKSLHFRKILRQNELSNPSLRPTAAYTNDGSDYMKGNARRAVEILQIRRINRALCTRYIFRIPDIESSEIIAADAIQNLRQALDHAACACARSIGKTDKGTYFPLVERPDQLEDRIKDQAQKLPPSIKDLIRKAEPGGGLLYELHSLGGGDKHRLTCDFRHQAKTYPRFMRASKGGWLAAGFPRGRMGCHQQ